jgi:nitrite reductase/ring-hydroxylating ferredoxin subunit
MVVTDASSGAIGPAAACHLLPTAPPEFAARPAGCPGKFVASHCRPADPDVSIDIFQAVLDAPFSAGPMRWDSQQMSGMTSDADVIENGRWGPNRRVLLLGAGACGVVGASTGCDSARGQAASGAGTGSPGDAPATAASTVASSGAVLAATTEVPLGGGIIVAGVLVVQPVSGTFKAFDAACPHRGVRVGPPKDGISTCPAHHSTFAIADGSRLSGPATQGLTEIAVSVREKNIVRA